MSKLPIATEGSSSTSKTSIRVTKADLEWAASEGLVSGKQADDLWSSLAARAAKNPGFGFATLAWYSGAIIVMLAMGWFMGNIWDVLDGGAVAVTSAIYALLFIVLGNKLWANEETRIPGGLLFTLAVAITPLGVFGVEKFLGLNVSDSGPRLLLELSMVGAGVIAVYFRRFPFLTAPIAIGLWLLTMDVSTQLLGDHVSWDSERMITLGFGLAMLIGSYLVDRRTREDFSFWGYLVGATAFWWALTLSDQNNELAKFAYFSVNVGLMFLSVLLNRKIFTIYGAIGAVGYLGHLAWSVFENTPLFPVVLSLMGLAIIFVGIKYHKNSAAIDRAILNLVPASLRSWLPSNR
jgi:hypothetical protein